jgi:hypothetical protein
MEAQINTLKTLPLVKIKFKSKKTFNNWGFLKIRANLEKMKVQYYEMV